MRCLVNADEMKRIDNYSIQVIGIPSLVLMEKAAMAVAKMVMEFAPDRNRAAIICGVGNNGGDGVAVGRLLLEYGYRVHILVVGDMQRASTEMKKQLEIASNLDMHITYWEENKNRNDIFLFEEYNIIIDALFGIGLTRAPEGIYEDIIEQMNQADATVFAVDIPSGVSASTGKILKKAVKADYTITFGYNKVGLVLYPGVEYAGKVIVADIGFPWRAEQNANPRVYAMEETDIHAIPDRKRYSNKGTYGRVLIIGGSRNMSGACYLAAKAAYRTGAGIVKIFTVEENRQILQTLLPEAILDTYRNEPWNELEHRLSKALEWATAIVIGPGLGTEEQADRILQYVIKNTEKPLVADADALNLLAKNWSMSFPKFAAERKENIILTPHLREMARLGKCTISDIRSDMVSYARAKAQAGNCVLALKDARTIVTNGEHTYINLSGNSGMATAGSGDVLSGIIGGLLAQGLSGIEAASIGVELHGLAGDKKAEEMNEYSLMAEDIIDGITQVLHDRR